PGPHRRAQLGPGGRARTAQPAIETCARERPGLFTMVEESDEPSASIGDIATPVDAIGADGGTHARADGAAARAAGFDAGNLMTLYLRDVRRYRPLDVAREAALLARMEAGDESARDLLICHHLGLVIAMARRFMHRGLDLLDLIGEGNLGLLVALEKFDHSLGLRLSTYAVWWIRYYLQTAVATQVPIVRPPLRAQRRAGREAWLQWCS